MKKATLAAVLASLSTIVLAAGPLAARVNGVEITAQEVDEMNEAIAERRGFKLKNGHLTDELVIRELLAQEGIRQGKDKNLSKSELASAVFKEYAAANVVREADARQAYDKLKEAAPKKKEYKIRGIVVKTEAEAKAIIEGLDAGKSFSSFVGQSIDENSKKDDGVMGWFELSDVDTAYQMAIMAVKPGAYYKKPVPTSYGYSVVKLDDVRDGGFPEYSELRETLAKQIAEERREKLLKPLRDNAKIERFPGYEAVKVVDPKLFGK